MKLTWAYTVLISIVCFGFNKVGDRDYFVYLCLIDNMRDGDEKRAFIISDSTSKNSLHNLDFRSIESRSLSKDKVDKIKSPSWKEFLHKINIKNLRDSLIDKRIGKMRKVDLFSGIKNGKSTPLSKILSRKKYRDSSGLMFFSPIIYSQDRSKAVCVVYTYRSPEQAGEVVYFLERESDNTWSVYTHFLIGIS